MAPSPTATRVVCTLCGSKFNIGRDAQHRASRWHEVARLARNYHKVGVSYAEIGRQLGLSRYYVMKKLREDSDGVG